MAEAWPRPRISAVALSSRPTTISRKKKDPQQQGGKKAEVDDPEAGPKASSWRSKRTEARRGDDED